MCHAVTSNMLKIQILLCLNQIHEIQKSAKKNGIFGMQKWQMNETTATLLFSVTLSDNMS